MDIICRRLATGMEVSLGQYVLPGSMLKVRCCPRIAPGPLHRPRRSGVRYASGGAHRVARLQCHLLGGVQHDEAEGLAGI